MPLRPLLAAACLAALPAWGDIYKYTDENGVVNYTNLPGHVPARAERIAVEPGTSPPAPPSANTAAGSAKARSAAPSPAGFPHVDNETQRKREEGRRQILESEAQSEHKALEDARKALAGGQEFRPGPDGSYAKYLDRLKTLQDAVNAHEANLEALQKEIGSQH